MRFTSLAVCAALIGSVAAASTPASAQGYGYGYGGYGGGYGYRRPWAPNPNDPTRAYRERQIARESAWRANAAAAAGDYDAARYYSKRANKWGQRSRVDQYYSGGY